jgi:hypothetical protein
MIAQIPEDQARPPGPVHDLVHLNSLAAIVTGALATVTFGLPFWLTGGDRPREPGHGLFMALLGPGAAPRRAR